jgi:DNA repair exonuclease SbcCD nuclease subunit
MGGPETVSRQTIPLDFEHLVVGHIHRHQILSHPLKPGLKFAYPDSSQRIRSAEMIEGNGFAESVSLPLEQEKG